MKKLLTVAMIGLLACSLTGADAFGKKVCNPAPKAAAAKTAKTTPDVKLPFTFNCQHCQMKITIKTAADWSKDCGPCACGVSNLECYKQPKK